MQQDSRRELLLRLKRRVWRERSRYARIYKTSNIVSSKERAWGEMAVCSIFTQWLNAELKKLV